MKGTACFSDPALGYRVTSIEMEEKQRVAAQKDDNFVDIEKMFSTTKTVTDAVTTLKVVRAKYPDSKDAIQYVYKVTLKKLGCK